MPEKDLLHAVKILARNVLGLSKAMQEILGMIGDLDKRLKAVETEASP